MAPGTKMIHLEGELVKFSSCEPLAIPPSPRDTSSRPGYNELPLARLSDRDLVTLAMTAGSGAFSGSLYFSSDAPLPGSRQPKLSLPDHAPGVGFNLLSCWFG